MADMLQKHEGPIYTCELDDRCPGLVEYPLEEVVKDSKLSLFKQYSSIRSSFCILE